MKPRKIAVLTTGRADYGLLYWLIDAIRRDRALKLQLVVSGMHLSPAFGNTVREIERDGVPIAARVPLSPAGDSREAAAAALARGTAGFAKAFARLRPDILVVLGDRFELLAAASAAVVLGVPIAHLHGGEASEGVIDEQVRHAVTKLSHLHFTASAPYRRRVIQMGEDPRRVFDVGAPGLEYLQRLKPAALSELEKRVGMPLGENFALATYHPVGGETVEPLLAALDALNIPCVITYANFDAGGRAINAKIRAFAAKRPGRIAAVPSLGQCAYLSLMARAAVVVGNSSSGVIEAPSAGAPTVNVGERQRGRLRAASVLDCAATKPAILKALRRALSPAFRRRARRARNPYGDGRVAARIVARLKSAPLGPGLMRKSFHER